MFAVRSDDSQDYMDFGIVDTGLSWWDNLGKGVPVSTVWRPMRLEAEGEIASDSPSVWSGTLALSRRSWDTVKSLIAPYGEVFDLLPPADGYVLFNPTCCCLELSAEAVVRRFESGRIKHLVKPVVRRGSAEGLVIGKLRESPAIDIFVGEAFVELWVKAGFTGLVFEPVREAEE
jgi:hypothetical protein